MVGREAGYPNFDERQVAATRSWQCNLARCKASIIRNQRTISKNVLVLAIRWIGIFSLGHCLFVIQAPTTMEREWFKFSVFRAHDHDRRILKEE